MADTTFTDGVTLTAAAWFNDINKLYYTIFGGAATVAAAYNTLHAAAGLGFKVGVTSRALDAASSSQAVTGVGFKPKAILLFATCGTVNEHASIGFTDGTTSGALYRTLTAFATSASPTLAWITNGTYSQTADLTSLDSDGFTLAWTKTGSPSSATITLSYLALR